MAKAALATLSCSLFLGCFRLARCSDSVPDLDSKVCKTGVGCVSLLQSKHEHSKYTEELAEHDRSTSSRMDESDGQKFEGGMHTKDAVDSPEADAAEFCLLSDSESEWPLLLSVNGKHGANTRMITAPTSPSFSKGSGATVHCKGSFPSKCNVPAVKANNVAQCPDCPCEQDTSKPFRWQYLEILKGLVDPECGSKPGLRLLHFGLALGTFVTAMKDTCANSINDVVELDPRIVHLAHGFGGARWDGTNIGSCERILRRKVQSNADKYDFIVLDVTTGKGEVPKVCRDEGFARDAFAMLHDGGCLLWNHFIDEIGHAETKPIFDRIFGTGCRDGTEGVVSFWCKGSATPNCVRQTIDRSRPRLVKEHHS